VAPIRAQSTGLPVVTLADAQRLFYGGHYDAAAAMALTLRAAAPDDLATYELRTSALHFRIKREMGDAADKGDALKHCLPCPALLDEMTAETEAGQTVAHARLKESPKDAATLFYLGKIDLNHVWLYLGTLGRKTGWNEYWEARHSLDAVLKLQPDYVRARVARAWIDYIVDTRVPWALQWVLGGGNKKHALAAAREAADADTDFYSRTEARFSLWEMLAREKRFDEAVTIARRLAIDFPDNRELVRFIARHAPAVAPEATPVQ
jgi:tetratricopeptide (TPR) repeat protein